MLHPLSLFPNLFSYPFLAYFILRLVVAWFVFRTGMVRWNKAYKYVAILDFITALLLLLGLYTQGALIAAIVLFAKEFFLDWKTGTPTDDKEKIIMIIVAIVAFCLLFLGPGAFSLDYPL